MASSQRSSEAVKSEKQLVDSISRFHRYLESPGRVVWINFLGGIFRGLGTAIGATIVFGVLIWFLTSLVDLPLIGSSIAAFEKQVKSYASATQYEDEFERLEAELKAIRLELSAASSK